MSISQALSKLKRLPIRGQLGLRLIDPLEQNQRFGAKLKVPKLFIPPLATKYRPLILWEVNRVLWWNVFILSQRLQYLGCHSMRHTWGVPSPSPPGWSWLQRWSVCPQRWRRGRFSIQPLRPQRSLLRLEVKERRAQVEQGQALLRQP